MLRFVADENCKRNIVDALRQRSPDLDIVRVQDVGLRTADDPTILEWAAQQGRILLTHDAKTMIAYAYDRVQAGKRMPGVFEIKSDASVGSTVDDLLLLAEGSFDDEWEGRVYYLPLK